MVGIYKITSPKNKIYIGSSSNITQRFAKYKNLKCEGQHKVFRSLKKYGVENHTFEIIAECTIEDMFSLECYYGNLYNVLGINGLNLALPKKDVNFQCKSPSVIEKHRLSSLGEKNVFYGRKHTEETKQKISDTKKKNFTEDIRLKLRNASIGKVSNFKGKSHSNLSKEKNREKKIKYVYQIKTPRNEILTITSLSLFAKQNKLNDSALLDTFKGVNYRGAKVTHHKGYKILDKVSLVKGTPAPKEDETKKEN